MPHQDRLRQSGRDVLPQSDGRAQLVVLPLTATGTITPLLFFAIVNLLLGLGVLFPLPSVDGEVIWHELFRS